MRIQALSRPVACFGVCVCVFGCFLSIIALQSCLFEGTPPSLPQYIQLKIGHGFFKFYLKRLLNYESAECFCYRNTIQNLTHLVLECSEYRVDRVETFEGLDNDQKSMEYLFNTRIGREKLFKFLEKTKIASKKWLLRSS